MISKSEFLNIANKYQLPYLVTTGELLDFDKLHRLANAICEWQLEKDAALCEMVADNSVHPTASECAYVIRGQR